MSRQNQHLLGAEIPEKKGQVERTISQHELSLAAATNIIYIYLLLYVVLTLQSQVQVIYINYQSLKSTNHMLSEQSFIYLTPNRHNAHTQCGFNVDPLSTTPAQH